MNKGYTLAEVLIILGITTIVGVAAFMNLPVLFRSTKLLDSVAAELSARLNDAREKAISQADEAKWGVHLDAVTADGHFYKVFSGDSYAAGTIKQTIAIPSSIVFLNPSQGNTDDIIFEKVTGAPNEDHNIVLALSDDHSIARYISISKGTGLITRLNTVPEQNFLASLSPSSGTVTAGSSVTSDIALTITAGAPTTANFSATNLPAGTGVSFSPATCSPTCSTVMTLTTNQSTPAATTAITVTATSGSVSRNLTFSLTVQQNPPSAPQNLSVVAGLNKTDLSWQAPASQGSSAITGYNIYRSQVSGGEVLLTTVGDVLTYTDNGLVNGFTYYYQVSAINAVGEGTRSSESFASLANRVFVTGQDYRGDLGGLSGADTKCVTLANSASLGGNWKAWLSSSVTSASSRLFHSSGPYKLVNGTIIANNWTDLTDGTLSAPINVTQTGGVPPGWQVRTNTTTAGNILSTDSHYHCYDWTSTYWSGLYPSGGSPTAVNSSWTQGTNTSCYGSGPLLYCMEQPTDPPSAPQNLAASISGQSVILNWQAPAYNFGSPVSNYKIYRGTSSGGETLLTTVTNVLTYTDSAVTGGTFYYYKISAVNAAGEGIMSNEVLSPWSGNRVFVTNGNISGSSISNVYAADNHCQTSANTAGLGGAWLAWMSDTTNWPASRFTQTGTPYYFANGWAFANNWADLTDGTLPSTLSFTEYGAVKNASYVWTSTLENGTASNYKCSEGAYGSIGYSGNVNYAWSHVIFGYGDYSSCGGNFPLYCFEQPLHVSYVKNLTLSASDSQVVLNWTAPDYDGGSAITNYKIYRGTVSNGETLLTTVGNVLTYTDTTAVNGTVYYYKVSAVNAAGREGDRSLGASAVPGFLPTAPQSPVATAAGIQIDLQWTAPASQGSGPVTNYKIYRGTSSGGETLLTTTGNVLTYSDTNLPTGTRYYYKIAAVNVVGIGALSSEVNALTHTWQDVAGTGNYNESCQNWLTRTGQWGRGTPYTRVMDSTDGVNYVPSYTGRCTYHADPFASIGSISPYTTADPTMYPISGGTGFGLYSKTQSLR